MSHDTGGANLSAAAAFVDELARQGIRHAVLCPGSRSTPLAVALAAHPDVRLWVQIDERAAAFFALGMARQRGEPVAILSTSGTAAANFLPAAVEARLGRVPLLVLTADRPPELRGWGAAQTIDQLALYGSHAKWFADMPVPEESAALIAHLRATAARATTIAATDPAGPVHLNFPFREPLLPVTGDVLETTREAFALGRGEERRCRFATARIAPDDGEIGALAELVAHNPRGLIVCGPGETSGLSDAAARLARVTGYPILADPLSGVRFGPHDRSRVIDTYDPLLRDPAIAAREPDVVIRTGAIPTSKPLLQFLAARRGRAQILIDPGEPRDPDHLATTWLRSDPALAINELAAALDPLVVAHDSEWREAWLAADRAAHTSIEAALRGSEELFEGRAAAEVCALLDKGATLVVGNSMPVRNVDAFVRGDQRDLRIVSNRGANGIDGVVSTALGAAAVARGRVVLLVGDLSFYHDLNGLLAARRFGLDTTVVVINNDGGGIFSFLPQAERLDQQTFELLFGTPANLDIASAARLYGLAYARPRDWHEFRRDFCRAGDASGVSIIEVVTDRERNVAQHRAVWTAVGDALRGAGF